MPKGKRIASYKTRGGGEEKGERAEEFRFSHVTSLQFKLGFKKHTYCPIVKRS